jgi:hypothetical protein
MGVCRLGAIKNIGGGMTNRPVDEFVLILREAFKCAVCHHLTSDF